MRNKKNKHIGIEIDPELHYISKYYGRSPNGEILYLIRQEIKAASQDGLITSPPNGSKPVNNSLFIFLYKLFFHLAYLPP